MHETNTDKLNAKLQRLIKDGIDIKTCMQDIDVYKQFPYLSTMVFLTLEFEVLSSSVGEGAITRDHMMSLRIQ